jgi:opacity protein-like surface antigen
MMALISPMFLPLVIYFSDNIMKKYLLITIVNLFLIIFVLCANAKDGIYFTFETGWAGQSGLPSAAMVGASSKSTPPIVVSAVRGAVGYNHDFCSWLGFAFEVGFGRYGGTKYTFPNGTAKIISTTVEFLTKTMFHINPKWDILFTLGGIRHTSKISGVISANGRMKIQPEIGLGSMYNLNKHWGLSLGYNHTIGNQLTMINGSERKEPSLNEVLAGIRYTFS